VHPGPHVHAGGTALVPERRGDRGAPDLGPEFFGDVILVNGKVWPYLEVEPRKYRFRFLNGAQARFFSLALADRINSTPGPAFYQIASDGGYLSAPVVLNDPSDPQSPRLLMGPGERCDVVVDFSAYAPGREFLLKNTAKAPFPSGKPPIRRTVGQIMLFRVVPLKARTRACCRPRSSRSTACRTRSARAS
jgi:spore coat protein A